MKAWQIFAVGTFAAVAFFTLEAYEAFLAAIIAILIIAVVVLGFLLRPRNEVFYLRTTVNVPDPDYATVIEHDRLAVRVELTRLWLLFIPTFAALAFLLVTSVRGTTWQMSLLDSVPGWFYSVNYQFLLFFRLLTVAVFGLISSWLSERWVLRDASACSADTLQACETRILYSFKDGNGDYYGGDGFPVGSIRDRKLRTVVFYRTAKPQLNKISLCCLFHRPVIIGRGVTELNEAKVTLAVRANAVPQAR